MIARDGTLWRGWCGTTASAIRASGWARKGWMAPDFDEFDEQFARDFGLLD